jgi:hypothetical protein
MNRNTLCKFLFRVLAFLVLPLVIGCGGDKKRTISGIVSADGVPVERGFISFRSEDENGDKAGDQISSGRYRVSLVPGKYRAKVTINQPAEASEGDAREERKRRTKEMQKALKSPDRPPPPQLIGDNEVHEITADTTTLDLNLQSPSRRRR